MFSKLILIATVFTLVTAKPLLQQMTVHESLNSIPYGFVDSGPADATSVLRLRLALAQNDPDGLIDELYSVSTPDNLRYGQYLSKEEVEKFVAPKPETVEAVNNWLKDAGVSSTTISPAGDWLEISLPVSKASSLFDAAFAVYTHTATGKQAIRTLGYSIPNKLLGHLDLVHPTVVFPSTSSRRPVVSAVGGQSQPIAACNSTSITPSCVQALYGIPTAPATQASNTLGVSGFLDEFANKADLATFLNKNRPDLYGNATTFSLQTIDGGQNNQTRSAAGLEANLDIQYTVGLASGVPITFISVGDDFHDGKELEGFLDIMNFLSSEEKPPQVLSTSYLNNEPGFSLSMANKFCYAVAQLSARGVSVLFASGDDGVSGGQAGEQAHCSTFVPTFPAGCPFITSVGATTLLPDGTETGANFSSGGFSNLFGTPSYQSAVVEAYLSRLGSTNSGKFNASGRAYPDVALVGTDVEIVVDGEFGTVFGTSSSTPMFASIIALLNDELIAAGKSPLGFLNPFLYANSQAFNDITSGSNPGCGTDGFPAGTGWDPVTGLGTPNFAALREAAGLS